MSVHISESITHLLKAKKFTFDSLNAPTPSPVATLVETIPITSGGVPGQLPLLTEKEAVCIKYRMFALNPAGESGAAEGIITVRGPLAPPAGSGLPTVDGYGAIVNKVRAEGAIDGSGNLAINAFALVAGLAGASGYIEILDVDFLSVA